MGRGAVITSIADTVHCWWIAEEPLPPFDSPFSSDSSLAFPPSSITLVAVLLIPTLNVIPTRTLYYTFHWIYVTEWNPLSLRSRGDER